MSISIGAPVQYYDGNTVQPGLVRALDGSGEPREVIYYSQGSTPIWQVSPTGLVKDITLTTSNSWAPVAFLATDTVTSGS